MPSYRIYKLNPAGRIEVGAWVEAPDDEGARVRAHDYCDEASPQVELWQGRRCLGRISCRPKTEARRAQPRSRNAG
jgi:hypothetical protein